MENERFDLEDVLRRASDAPRVLTPSEIEGLLAIEDEDGMGRLFAAAHAVKVRRCGIGVAARGLVEAGNMCAKDCLYCGIRKSNSAVRRYALSANEIVSAAEEAKREYRTLGKRTLDPDEDWTDVTDVQDLDAAGYWFFKASVRMKE